MAAGYPDVHPVLHFGGVTRTTIIDNLKAAVLKAVWFDPKLNPK